MVKNNQDNDLNDKKLTFLDSITVNRNPSLDNEVSNKRYIDDEVDKHTIIRFNQTLEKYLKVSVGNDIYNFTKYNKLSINDITEIKFSYSGIDSSQEWNNYCKKKVNQSRINDFIKSTRSHSPAGVSGATSTPPIGNAFMYSETSGNNSGNENILYRLKEQILFR